MAGTLLKFLKHVEPIPCTLVVEDDNLPCDVKFGFGEPDDPYLYQIITFKSLNLDLSLDLSFGHEDIKVMNRIPGQLRSLADLMEKYLNESYEL